MAELDAELLERVARWCAEAGRQAGAGEIRRALAPLGWDEILAVRALVADPPPARPLGPQALADIARGAPPDVAAERERGGRYRREPEEDDEDRGAPPEPVAPAPRAQRRPGGRARAPAKAAVVIRRARDQAPAPAVAPARLPDVAELANPEGRSVLERLIRRHGARRGALAAALATAWRREDGEAPDEADLAALLDHHGLAHAFERRERDEILHALRAAGGVRAAAAARLGLDLERLDAAIARLGAGADAERIRDQRRAELRGRATLADRVRLFLTDEPRLADLGLLEEFEADLRARLPEHLRALRAGREPIGAGLATSLSLTPALVTALAARFALELGGATAERRGGGAPRGERTGRGGRAGSPRPPGPSRRGAGAGGTGARREAGPRGPPPAGAKRAGSPPRAGGRAAGPRGGGVPSGPRAAGGASGPRPRAGPPRPRPGAASPRAGGAPANPRAGAGAAGPRPRGGPPRPRPSGGAGGPPASGGRPAGGGRGARPGRPGDRPRR